MNTVKKILVLLLAVMLIVTVTGCQKNETPSDGPVEVELFNRKTQAVPVLEKIIEKFHEQNPDIIIKLNTPTGSAQQGTDPFAIRVASGDVPDIFTEWPCLPEYVVRSRGGIMMDLSNMAFIDNIESRVLEQISVDGKYYSLPLSLNTTAVAYNRKIFKENGWEIPKTYDELIELCKEIQAKGLRPFVFGDREAWTLGHPVQGLYHTSIPNVTQFWRDVASGKTNAKDSAELRRVAEKVLELHKYGQEDYLGAAYQALIVDFATEEAVMMWSGNWVISGLLQANPDLDFSFFPFPADKEEDTSLITGIDFALAAYSGTKHPEEVKRVLEFFAQVDIAQLYADEDGAPSAIKGVQLNVPQLQELDLVNALANNQTGDWSAVAWGAGMESEMASVLQNLVTHHSIDQFLDEVDSLLKTAGAPDARN